MELAPDVPQNFDVNTPNMARVYDYWLGGKDNFAADREFAERIIGFSSAGNGPTVVQDVRAARAFRTRAITVAAEAGIRQFLDLGAGLPTQDNVHDVAQWVNPLAQVVYVDYDPVVCTHGRALLGSAPGVSIVQADIRRPQDILGDPKVKAAIDFTRPMAVLLCAVVAEIEDAHDPDGIVASYAEVMAPGSYLILTHLSTDARPDDVAKGAELSKISSEPCTPRSSTQILRFFDGFDLLEPGLVNTPAWRPTRPIGDVSRYSTLGGVGVKR
jgi:SAM-dependent methyltransferase